MFVVRFEQGFGKVPWDSIQRPGNRIMFVSSHDEPTDFLTKVDQKIRVPHGGHSLTNTSYGFGDDILVFHRDDRDKDPHHLSYLWSPDPCGIDNDFSLDLSFFCEHLIDSPIL